MGIYITGITSKRAIVSIHPEAHTSMLHPLCGAKDVCYIEIKAVWPRSIYKD